MQIRVRFRIETQRGEKREAVKDQEAGIHDGRLSR
jgi:hypothetical protein